MLAAPYSILFAGLLAASALMLLAWLVQQRTRDAGLVDALWALGIGLLALFACLHADGDTTRRLLVAFMAGIWSFRLAFYLFADRVLGGQEDGRYRMLRARWGERAPRNFFLLFQANALLIPLFALPPALAAANPRPPGVWDALGALIWLLAVGGESLADHQLARFRRRPENSGRTCRQGLWRYSRHPNYFCEWLHWWAYPLLALGAPHGWAALLGPALMLFLLYRVTGIPYTEKRALESRGQDYLAYQQSTSAFFPWFPAKERP